MKTFYEDKIFLHNVFINKSPLVHENMVVEF